MENAPLYNDIAKGPENGRAFWKTTSDGVCVRIAHWPRKENVDQKGTVLIFPGRTEYIEKYGTNATDLATRGYDSVVIDWRGQGLSDRQCKDPMIGHVDRFSEYQRDITQLMEVVKTLDLPKPYVLLTHSMGGAIGLRALHEGLDVVGACFSAPMWGIEMTSFMRAFAWSVSALTHKTPLRKMRAPGTEDVPIFVTDSFEDNKLTTSQESWDLMRTQALSNPELTLGGPSLGWIYAALLECRALRKKASPDVNAITWLGTLERIVDKNAIITRMEQWPNGRLINADGHEHELLLSPLYMRGYVYDTIDELAGTRSTNTNDKYNVEFQTLS